MDDLTKSLIEEVKQLRQRVSALESREEDRRDANGAPIYPALTAGRVVTTGASRELATDNALVWDATNKQLGIGTASPNLGLDIESGADTYTGIELTNTNGTTRRWSIAANANNTGYGPGKGFFIRDITAGQTRLVVNSVGDVGIGTTNPLNRLHIVGHSRFEGYLAINRAPSGGVGLIVMTETNTPTSYAFVGRNNSDANLMYIRGDGLAWVNQNWTVASDARSKDQLEDLPVGRNALRSLLPRRYRLRRLRADGTEELSTKQHYGFVAQELREVMPELVEETEDGLAIRYGDLIPVLVKALQEQDDELETLKKTVEEQQKAIEQLTRAVEVLQRRQQP